MGHNILQISSKSMIFHKPIATSIWSNITAKISSGDVDKILYDGHDIEGIVIVLTGVRIYS